MSLEAPTEAPTEAPKDYMELWKLVTSLPRPIQREMEAFYGSPIKAPDPARRGRFIADNAWMETSLVRVPNNLLPGFPDHENGTVAQVWLHRRIAPLFIATWREVYAAGLAEHLSTFDGAFVPRYKNWDPHQTPSKHGYAAAVDFDARWNGYGVPLSQAKINREVVEIFERFGWSWGGRWKIPDAMHFEAAKPHHGVDWSAQPRHNTTLPDRKLFTALDSVDERDDPISRQMRAQEQEPFKLVLLRQREILHTLDLEPGERVYQQFDPERQRVWIDVRKPAVPDTEPETGNGAESGDGA